MIPAALKSFDGLLWFLGTLILLNLIQRYLHREIQSVLLIITRSPGVTVAIFSLLFSPGVLLHELSHLIMAKILRIRTGKFSLFPQVMPGGRLQMGYLEAENSDFFRDSLVGVAPLVTGILTIAFLIGPRLQLLVLWGHLSSGEWNDFFNALLQLPSTPYFWLWFFGAFIISSTMLPSESDSHAWLPLGLLAGILLALVILAGAGPWMLENLAPGFNQFLRNTSLILLVSIILHILLMLPLIFLHRLLSRLTGVDIH